MRMTTTLLVVGAVWMALSLVFCLALCVAAAKPMPKLEVEEEYFEPEHETMEQVEEEAVCVR